MSLSYNEMKCTNCNKADKTRLEMTVDKGKRKLVQFKVECDGCGAYSHHLQYTDINRAVQNYLEEMQK